jgi:hypothetical protein
MFHPKNGYFAEIQIPFKESSISTGSNGEKQKPNQPLTIYEKSPMASSSSIQTARDFGTAD